MINVKCFFKVILSLRVVWSGMPKLTKIKSLLFLCNSVKKKYISDEVDFLHADKYESMLQIDTMILMGMIKHFQSFQNGKFVMPLQYLKKEVRDEVEFLHADKHQISYKLISTLLASKSPTRWYHY